LGQKAPGQTLKMSPQDISASPTIVKRTQICRNTETPMSPSSSKCCVGTVFPRATPPLPRTFILCLTYWMGGISRSWLKALGTRTQSLSGPIETLVSLQSRNAHACWLSCGPGLSSSEVPQETRPNQGLTPPPGRKVTSTPGNAVTVPRRKLDAQGSHPSFIPVLTTWDSSISLGR
jgi:hypothetical protein